MELSFSESIEEIDLDFHRFLAMDDEVQYAVSYMAFTKYEVIILLRKDPVHNWVIIYKNTIPPYLIILEPAIDAAIKRNEAA